MNNTYFNKDIFPQNQYYKENQTMNQSIKKGYKQIIPIEQTIEKILINNIGKKIKIHMSFPNVTEQKDFTGTLEQIGNDFIIINEPSQGTYQILPINYINYITFIENINYNEDFYSNN